jgi:hypothetical protein
VEGGVPPLGIPGRGDGQPVVDGLLLLLRRHARRRRHLDLRSTTTRSPKGTRETEGDREDAVTSVGHKENIRDLDSG